jgi:FeS assembly SUF system protein
VNQERKIEIEEVGEAPKPPKARVSDAVEGGPESAPESLGARAPESLGASLGESFTRKRDYLEGFLARQPVQAEGAAPGGDLYEGVIAALKEIYDPEIPVNIYDLGLIYDVEISPEHHAKVRMTLTTPHCPVAESMPGEVELRVGAVPGIGSAEVELVWDPPWDPQKMSDEARLELGML